MDYFSYTPLNLGEREIRLTRLEGGSGSHLECELIHTTLDDPISYEALSYTWGTRIKTDTITIQGAKLPITLNLWTVLQDLRRANTDRYLWIDAICINQDDVHERGHQVQQMSDIYSRAERVLFYIGRPTDTTQLVMTILAELQKETTGNRWAFEDQRWDAAWSEVHVKLQSQHYGLQGKVRQGLQYLLGQSWFRRVWILQEVANAHTAVVYCGRHYVSASIFAVSRRLVGLEPDRHCLAVLELMPGPWRRSSEREERRDLYSLLMKFAGAEASDERDKIYALLGLCTDPEGSENLSPDYTKSDMDVIHTTVSYLCPRDIHCIPQLLYYTSMREFFRRLEDLDNDILAQLIEASNLTGIRTLLEKRRDHIKLDSYLMQAAAANTNHGKEIIQLFLQVRGERTLVDEALLHAVAENKPQGSDILKSILLYGVHPISAYHWGTLERFAVANGNDAVLCLALERGANAGTRGERERIALAQAAQKGYEGVVRLLFDRGVDINMILDGGISAIGLAAENGHLATVKLLFGLDPKVDLPFCSTETPLCGAARHGHTDVVRLLLDKGGDMGSKDGRLDLALSLAVQKGYTDITSILIDAGANVDSEDSTGTTPLGWASDSPYEGVAEVLLDKGATINRRSGETESPLYLAAKHGREADTQRLIEGGVDVNIKFRHGTTPIWEATCFGHKGVMQLLLDKGADVHAHGQNGRTPLWLAVRKGKEEEIRLLLSRTSDDQTRARNGKVSTELLWWAVHGGREAITRLVLDEGADIEMRDFASRTPLMVAAKEGYGVLVQLLLDRGADATAEDGEGRTPLDWARHSGHEDIIQLVSRAAGVE